MPKISAKRKGIWVLSSLMAGVLVFFCLFDTLINKLPWTKEYYPIVVLGDSVIGNVADGEGVVAYLEQNLGIPVLKGAFGGTCASYDVQTVYPYSIGQQLSLVKLSEAIANQDFSVQKSLITYGENYYYTMYQTANYFPDTIEALSRVDFNQVKYLIIEHGTNDYNQGKQLDNPEDPYDMETYGGALRYSIELLQKHYPDMQIVFITPTWCYIMVDGKKMHCDEVDFGGGYLEEYVNMELKIAQDYGLLVLDNYQDFAINQETEEQYFVDGLHLNQKGQQLLADRIADFIKEIL